jgi:hypothetical protein
LKNLINNNSVGLNVSSATGDTLKISGSISFGNVNGSVLSTGNNITLLSSAAQTASVNDITNNGANFNNSISGKVTMERYIPARRAWRLMAVPFQASGAQTLNQAWQEGVVNADYVAANNKNPNPGYGMHISGSSAALGFDPTPNNNPSVKVYNATADTLTGIGNTTSTKVTDASAFMVFVRGDRSTQLSSGATAAATSTVLRASGNLKTGSQVFNFAPQLSSTRVMSNLPVWSVVGNPFASTIDLTKVGAAGDMSINAVSVWDPNLTGSLAVGAFQALVKTADAVTGEVYYLAVPGGGSYGGSLSPVKTIQSGQAFLIQRTGKTAGSITINENAKSTQNTSTAFRPSRLPVLQALCASLYFQNADSSYTLLDGNATMFNDEYHDAVDVNDVAKLKNMSENFSIVKDNQTLIVEKRTPIVGADTISYNLSQLKVRNYQFKIEPKSLQLQSGMEAYLEDSFTHTSVLIDLQQPTLYNFSVINSPESYNARRFRVVFNTMARVILPVTFRTINDYRQQENIKVDWQVENETHIV